jgi:hypothetical protein
MDKHIAFNSLLGGLLLGACAAVQAKPPTCTQPVGRWQDQLQSDLEIKTYDPATGAISGRYVSHPDGTSYPMVGWINSAAPIEPNGACKAGKCHHADVFTFAVRWGGDLGDIDDPGNITAWTGTCGVDPQSGREQIFALWHTVRSNSGFDWDHTLTGAEPFVPFK